MTTTLPKLAELTPVPRRILCATELHPEFKGIPVEYWYTQEDDCSQDYVWKRRNAGGTITAIQLDDPDEDANHALALADHMATLGWWCELGNGLDKTWECEFSRTPTDETEPDDIGSRHNEIREIIYGSADTLPRAIVSAFLLARRLAQ